MKLKEFDYELPKNLIAQTQIKPRDHSRLLVLDKRTGKMEHRFFYDLVDYFRKGDLLVLNNSKVMPARLPGVKKTTGGKMEIFLLKRNAPGSFCRGGIKETWQCLVGGKVRGANMEVEFNQGLKAVILKNNNDGTWEVGFNLRGKKMMEAVKTIGEMPLPPYIKSSSAKASADEKNYQTVYADEKKTGSVAAPTAGLHFTPALMRALKKKGVQFEYATLHVGLGTFASVKAERIEDHKMHAEWVEVKKSALNNIIKAKKEGRRVIAVGTTSARILETAFAKISLDGLKATKDFSAWTDIFIYPGYKFKAIDAIITNFHLPKSTLLMLVSAFACAERSRSAGVFLIKKAYAEAIKKKYRFFSYGDAMFIR